MSRSRAAAAALVAAIALPTSLAVEAAAAQAVATLPTVKRPLASSTAQARDCAKRASRDARGVDTATWRAPMSGYATIRLGARSGDWDLAVYDKRTRRYVGSSSAFGSREVVQEYVLSGTTLLIQGCRRSGSARTATASVSLADVEPLAAPPPTPSLVRVPVKGHRDVERLESLGVDVTHNVQDGRADVIVAGAQQRELLTKNGFSFTTLVSNMTAHYAKSRRADARLAVAGGASLPSGQRSTYRTYEEVQQELKTLTKQYASIVKPMTLPKTSFQGRPLDGVEIAANVRSAPADDGRPVYLLVAMHHAREWPSVEAAMEFVWMLAKGYGRDDRITSLLKRERVVVVPLINPDGYVESRTTFDPIDTVYGLGFNPNLDNPTPDPSPDEHDLPSDCLISPLLTGDDTSCDTRLSLAEAIAPPGGLFAYRRKNCNGAVNDPGVPCALQYGVDPNRNYGERWGGPGSSGDRTDQTYRGTGPWSEPETQAVHEYSQRRQITNIVTVHNVAALVLRPPGLSSQGLAPDEAKLKEVGDRMGRAAGYKSQYGWELYDTTGTTEDWNYAAQGAFGYTIEIGPKDGEFHMPYETGFVQQWNGEYAGNGLGLREALLIGAEAAADPRYHSIITGRAGGGRTLRLSKSFDTFTSPYCEEEAKVPLLNYEHPTIKQIPHCINPHDAEPVPDGLDTTMVVPTNGKFTWHVNPSTRPFEGVDRRIPGGIAETPYRTDAYRNQEELRSSELPQQEGDDRATYADRPFTITPEEAAKRLMITLEWAGPADDYDLVLYRREANGDLTEVDASESFPGIFEQITVEGDDVRPGDYVLRVNNFLAFDQEWHMKVERYTGEPDTIVPGRKETWTLTCEDGRGNVLSRQQVIVDRGQTVNVDVACSRATPRP